MVDTLCIRCFLPGSRIGSMLRVPSWLTGLVERELLRPGEDIGEMVEVRVSDVDIPPGPSNMSSASAWNGTSCPVRLGLILCEVESSVVGTPVPPSCFAGEHKTELGQKTKWLPASTYHTSCKAIKVSRAYLFLWGLL